MSSKYRFKEPTFDALQSVAFPPKVLRYLYLCEVLALVAFFEIDSAVVNAVVVGIWVVDSSVEALLVSFIFKLCCALTHARLAEEYTLESESMVRGG